MLVPLSPYPYPSSPLFTLPAPRSATPEPPTVLTLRLYVELAWDHSMSVQSVY